MLLENLDTPALLVDIDRLERNITRMAAIADSASVSLRPHAKTHKMPQVAHMQVAHGSHGITVAKLGEAEVMASGGIQDIFIAYPIVGGSKLERLCTLASQNRVRVAADSWEVLAGISRAALQHGVCIEVLLEVDTGFGRCGLQTPEEATALAKRALELRGVKLCGVMGFGGQSYDAQSREDIAAVGKLEATQAVAISRQLRELGVDPCEVSVGSTPTSPYAAQVQGVTEIRPGTYVFSDRTQAHLGWGTLDDCALTVLSTVVSRPTSQRAVVDVGTKGLSSDTAPIPGFGDVLERSSVAVAKLTEEHGILEVGAEDTLPVGTKVRIVPNHACGTLNMFDEAWIVRDGQVEDRWEVAARGKMQ